MITEDYVSFEIAKLLKEKGFDEPCYMFYKAITYLGTEPNSVHTVRLHEDEPFNNSIQGVDFQGNDTEEYAMPTLQMVMKWFREVHNIFIGVNTVIGSGKNWGYEVFIQKQEIPIPSKILWDWFNTYEEACESAIKYCLENLI